MLDDQQIKQLLLKAAARDTGAAAAFERLYKICAPTILGVALRVVQRRELAEEVLHDTFVKIWNAAGSFDPLANQPVAWMAAIARNRALDIVQSADVARVESYDKDSGNENSGHNAHDSLLDALYDWSGDTGADDDADARRAQHWLRGCIDELSAAEKQSIVLAYHHGLSHGDLAQHLNKPLGTVKTWIRRALASLRDCVEACMKVSTSSRSLER